MTRRFIGDTLVVATHNRGKAAELAELLRDFNVRILSHADLGLEVPEETGTTFLDNAELKARAAAVATGMPSLADDSGITVDALDGAPGIHTADWGGPGRDWMLAMRRVNAELNARGVAQSAEARGAAFVCALALCWPDGHCERFLGRMPGHVVWPPRGTFGHAAMLKVLGRTASHTSMYGWPVTMTYGPRFAVSRSSLDPATRWSASTPIRRPGPGSNSASRSARLSRPSSCSTTTPSTRRS